MVENCFSSCPKVKLRLDVLNDLIWVISEGAIQYFDLYKEENIYLDNKEADIS
jgi:hypothetical protein